MLPPIIYVEIHFLDFKNSFNDFKRKCFYSIMENICQDFNINRQSPVFFISSAKQSPYSLIIQWWHLLSFLDNLSLLWSKHLIIPTSWLSILLAQTHRTLTSLTSIRFSSSLHTRSTLSMLHVCHNILQSPIFMNVTYSCHCCCVQDLLWIIFSTF